MHLRVIEGGLSRPAEPRPICWNYLPASKPGAALVIRQEGALCVLAVDDGRPFLIGLRDVDPVKAPHVLHHWMAWAKGEGLKIRDER